jgi:uncharacterized coiled-coil protein SlyX
MANDFENIRDPFDRLEELEFFTTAHNQTLEQIADELRNHGELFMQVSDSLVQVSTAFEKLQKQNVSLQKQTQALHHRLKVLETKETKND